DAKMSLTGSASDADREKAAKYSEEQSEIQKEARARETEAKQNFHEHEVFARGVTLFQIAIAIAAISALTKRRRYWLVSMIMGAIGCIFLFLGFVHHLTKTCPGDFCSNETQTLLAGQYDHGRHWLHFPCPRFCSTLNQCVSWRLMLRCVTAEWRLLTARMENGERFCSALSIAALR